MTSHLITNSNRQQSSTIDVVSVGRWSTAADTTASAASSSIELHFPLQPAERKNDPGERAERIERMHMSDTSEQAEHGRMVPIESAHSAGGVHCETTTLGVLLAHAGVELSEPMLFGLGGGLSFIYWDSERQPVPFLGGRVKPFVLTEQVTQRLALTLRVSETTSARRGWEQVRTSIDQGVPVGLQLDSHDLDYFTTRAHFAGHIVALYGYDDTSAYLIDTAQQGGRVRTRLESLARARAARGPMSARHRSFTIDPPTSGINADQLQAAVIPALSACAHAFLNPPIANLGGRGIHTAATRIPSLLDRVDDPERDLVLISMLLERGGTGGALFRILYRDFLAECSDLLDGRPEAAAIRQAQQRFTESAQMWTRVAHLIHTTGVTGNSRYLTEAGHDLTAIAEVETAAMTVLQHL